MKLLLAFLSGVALTCLVQQYFTPPAIVKAVVRPSAPLADARPTPAPEVEVQTRHLTWGSTPVTIQTFVKRTLPPAPAVAPPTRTEGLNLSEETVKGLEKAGPDLRQHAYAEKLTDGWKLHILPEDRELLQAGIKDGDFVTRESLDQEAAKPERAGLAKRFETVLNDLVK